MVMARSLVFCALFALATAANRNLFCFNCYEMIDIIEQTWLIDEPATKTRLDNWCDAVYGHLGDMAAQCKKWIDDDLENIVDKLNNGWSAEAICKDLHLCD
ncbi:hypothetical protein PRIPAC_84740 [Pristionchus pacificus]|uniref:Saposin B-type domain-containing protein n=1 Tax=Pristionchus pacificus TaxID=54126 RepID=A0A2A6BNJ8_PRIPA|nr:hypothetical protein PRIPAC_84740 [Pristionchus pacificus]|eukprot:PDM67479.1 hypothetical protein PRIPAC_48896 [Pristionchus pacificus]